MLDKNGNPFDGKTLTSVNKVTIQKISGASTVVSDDTTYSFSTSGRSSMIGWHDMFQATKTLDASVTLANGEGVLVSNAQGEDVQLRFSGEVEIAPMSFAIPYVVGKSGFAIFGNFTPSPISIKDIKVLNKDKVEFDGKAATSVNKITIQKIYGQNTVVSDDTTYSYSTSGRTTMIGWHDMFQATKTLDASVTLEPGEAVLVSNAQGEPVYFQLKNPLTNTYAPIVAE